jgi:hypothetical protein
MAGQRVEHIDRPLRLFCYRVDAREVVQVHDADAGITRERLQRGAMFSRAHCIRKPAGVGIRDPQAAVDPRIGRHLHEQRPVCGRRAVGIRAGPRSVSQRGVRLRARERPRRPILIEVGRAQGEQVPPLGIVECPLLPPLRCDMRDE